jgi:hypothetical protein
VSQLELPDLTRHLPAYYSVIEEIVEGLLDRARESTWAASASFSKVKL